MSKAMNVIHQLFGGMSGGNSQQAPSPAQGANPALANQPGTPGNIPQNNTMPANPNNPTAPAEAPTAAPQGLDKFTDMWNIKPEDMPKPPESAYGGVTPEQVKAIAAQTDFSKVITPEMMQAISSGGEAGAAAMIQALNTVAQDTYAQGAQASMKLIDTALAKQREQFQAELPNLIKTQNVTNNLRNENPIFSHAATAPILDMFAKQLQLKNPNADAAAIQAQAKDFLLSFAEAANPTKKIDPSTDPKLGKTDWEDFL